MPSIETAAPWAQAVTEPQLRVQHARIVKAHGKSLIAVRTAEQAAQAEARARAELAESIAAAAPLLTAEQREQLRPILAGSIPTQADHADTLPAALPLLLQAS
jgi:hypothetical protein